MGFSNGAFILHSFDRGGVIHTLMESWCIISALSQSTIEWVLLYEVHSILPCNSVLVVHHEYFEHFSKKNLYYVRAFITTFLLLFFKKYI
jgi:hypothetical protein